ncbi:MAG: plastocyanin/azurin family copper-binding protein [Solirubrobacterales bacterium]
MKARNLLLMIPLGAALALLPAMASSETTPSVEAVAMGSGVYGPMYAWSPTQTTISQGGSVTFSTGSTNAPHGVIWTSAVKPTCANSVPVGENNFGEHWTGSCAFTQPGTYTFECSVHHKEMTGTITVTAAGTTTTTMSTPAPTPTQTTTTPPATPKPVTGIHLTRAQKLAKALKACRKKPKGKRAACRKRAYKRYGPKKK